MKKRINKLGLSLIELVVALPMLAFVFLGIAYMIAITGNFTSTGIAKAKTQVAANNILMLIKAERYSKLGDILGFVETSDTNGNKKVDGVEIPTNSFVHPDEITKLKLYLEEKDPGSDSNISSGNKICVIRVTAPDFNDIQTEIKTVSF